MRASSLITAALEDAALAAILGAPAARPSRGTALSLSAFAGFCIGAGTIFLAISLDHYLETIYTPPIAAAGTAAAAFAIAALILLGKTLSRPARSSSHLPEAAEELKRQLRGVVEELSSQIEGPVRDNPKTAMFLAALGGFLAGETHRR